jgi:hypothetical protein
LQEFAISPHGRTNDLVLLQVVSKVLLASAVRGGLICFAAGRFLAPRVSKMAF